MTPRRLMRHNMLCCSRKIIYYKMPATRSSSIYETLSYFEPDNYIWNESRVYFSSFFQSTIVRDLYVAQLIQGSDLSGSITLYRGAWIFSESAMGVHRKCQFQLCASCTRLWRKSSSSTLPYRTGWTFANVKAHISAGHRKTPNVKHTETHRDLGEGRYPRNIAQRR